MYIQDRIKSQSEFLYQGRMMTPSQRTSAKKNLEGNKPQREQELASKSPQNKNAILFLIKRKYVYQFSIKKKTNDFGEEQNFDISATGRQHLNCAPQCEVSAKFNSMLSFHTFPTLEEAWKRWKINIIHDKFTVTNHTRVCNRHFQAEDLIEPSTSTRRRELSSSSGTAMTYDTLGPCCRLVFLHLSISLSLPCSFYLSHLLVSLSVQSQHSLSLSLN